MDGKFAKYIKNFMQSYKIIGDKIEIQTDENDKSKPLSYELNAQRVEKCNEKLDEQYGIITKNEKEIKKDARTASSIFTMIYAIFFILFIVLSALTPATEIAMLAAFNICMITSAFLTAAGGLITILKSGKIEELLYIVKEYKKNRKNIEKAMQLDENVTKYLSEETKELIAEKTKLVESGKASEILDIDFMDKLLDKKSKGRRELINLLKSYKAIISLNEQPIYISPVKTPKTEDKKRTRKKEESK